MGDKYNIKKDRFFISFFCDLLEMDIIFAPETNGGFSSVG